ncbi:MarR family winged helix-turn-helix transcriptional regulator [Plantibacter sp. YIM 135347]|uniref:MarR family winged helix-turn-helix transcriptional regulator n=1 Tax=Plantibacter sp. YIM 135347 TaxID=3423919 RepID=UPI003D33BFB4
MENISGAQFARLLLGAFDSLVDEVLAELARAGHPELSVANEFAMQAIDAGAASASSLARALGVTRQAAAKTIHALEKLDYVGRTSDETDARRKALVLTERGREAIAIGAAAFDVAYREWCSVVGEDRASIVAEALRAIGLRNGAV